MKFPLKRVRKEVSRWPQISFRPHRFGGTEFRFRMAEVGHVHEGGIVDIPFPRPIRDALLAERLAEEHHWVPDSGWITFHVRGDQDLPHALWLLRLSYLRYALKIEGDPRGLLDQECEDLGLGTLLVAICHQTSPRSKPPLEGIVGGQRLRGWDYLAAKLESRVRDESQLLELNTWAQVTAADVTALFRDEGFGERLADTAGRASLICDLGQKMLTRSWQRADEHLLQNGDKDGGVHALAVGMRFSHDVANGGTLFATVIAKNLLDTHLRAMEFALHVEQLSASQKSVLLRALSQLGPGGLDWQSAVKREFEIPKSGLDAKTSAALAQIASAYESIFNDPSELPRLQRMIASKPQTLSIPNPQQVLAQKQELADRLSQVRSLLQ